MGRRDAGGTGAVRVGAAALAAAGLIAGCSGGGDEQAGATATPRDPFAAATQRPAGTPAPDELRIPLDDPEVQRVLAAFRDAGSEGEPFEAYRGPRSAFVALGCFFSPGAPPDRIETVVYVRGSYTSPSGKPSDTAMVQSLEGGASIATLYGNGASGPAAWCRPPR